MYSYLELVSVPSGQAWKSVDEFPVADQKTIILLRYRSLAISLRSRHIREHPRFADFAGRRVYSSEYRMLGTTVLEQQDLRQLRDVLAIASTRPCLGDLQIQNSHTDRRLIMEVNNQR